MRSLSFLALIVIFSACKDSSEKAAPPVAAPAAMNTDSLPNFFPVTTYLKGEMTDIKTRGLTPVQKISGAKDSAFIKPEDYAKVFGEFIDPVIDTANLKSRFTESKFKDETLNAFTFTYDPLPGKDNGFAFKHWDVYVDPETNKVTRIYLVKNKADGSQLQLTWQSGKWCKIISIKNGTVTAEEKISWTYE